MDWAKFAKIVRAALAALALCWAADRVVQAQSNGKVDENGMPKMRNTTQAQRKAAAKNKKQAGLRRIGAPAKGAKGTAGAASLAATTLAATAPAATPDYFGPYSNWANSPLPQGPINPVVTMTSLGGGYNAATPPLVTISDVYGMGAGATATATVDASGQVASVTVDNSGSNNLYAGPVVMIDPPPCTFAGCEIATASATIAGATSYAGGLKKFIDTLPNLTVATPDVVTYPGTDYYEIELIEYTDWKFHANLAATTLRGYHQTNNGTNVYTPTNTAGCLPAACTTADNTVVPPAVSYLGPAIVAQKGRPTRIKFTNNLPNTGAGGELFIPVDTSVMGAGSGYDPASNSVGTYPQNRGTLHLHGGFTPWVSDGTPHQWVTPTGEGGSLTTGVSTQPVPDMDLGSGNSMTFYWPNQQSGRLMFYHDHAYGITRLNVYAGEAAGYLLVDPVERKLTDGTTSTIPAMDDVPLVIQDKTFVWGSQATGTGTWATDPTWNWGSAAGSLWFPHVYMPNQNPWDISGANAMGRWDYALWFWPPYTGMIAHPDVPNPYYDLTNAPWEPPMIPGTPNPSLVPEAFMDTPLVNGKAYPTTTVVPKPYRLRILNACNDRFLNLSFFVADPSATTTTGVTGTEVKMVPFNSSQNVITPFPKWWYTPGLNFTFDDRAGGVPDPTTRGPAIIQIGTEGGLLPAPALIRNQPVNYTYNRRDIVVLSVQEKALFLGPAERADVIVDFSKFAGKTLILYNDAPAPVPAADQRIDYYTGGADQTDTGGAPPTLPGYGPNTRTVMRIVVGSGGDSSAPVDYYDTSLMGALNVALPAAFAASQDPIVVPQVAYNAAYPSSPTAADVPGANVSRISDTSLTFTPLGATAPAGSLSVPLQPKAIQELFELDYGRMNATLGVELKFTNGGNQTTLPFGYIDPATEFIDTSLTPAPPTVGDGTQIWKITHNGVDTHAIHVHLFNVQVLNRVGWDGAIRRPDPNELGWKETVRMNPLEDIIVALRPTTPQLPFGLPDSVRLLDVTTPPGTSGQFAPFGPDGNPANTTNQLFNFGWEYVWHCHLLGHEENDMMRPTVFGTLRALPAAPAPLALSQPAGGTITLNWTDTTPFNYATGFTTAPPSATLGNPANEIGFRIERSSNGVAFVPVGSALANATSYTDSTVPNPGTPHTYWYRVTAYNVAGDSSPAIMSILYVVPPTVTFTGAPGSAAYNTSFTVTATTNSSIMPAIAGGGACSVGPVSGSPASATALVTMTGSTGACALTASWAANAGYSAATATRSITATKATPTATFTGAPASAPYGATFAVATTTNSTSTAAITSSGACSNAGSLVTMTSGTGVCFLTATWAADTNYLGTASTQSTTATKVAPTAAFTGAPASAAYNTTFTVTAATNASTVPSITGTGACVFGPASGSSATITMTSGTGVCNLTANWAADGNYLAATASQSTTALPSAVSSLLLSPTSLVFGNQLVGTASIAQTVTLTNTGSTTVTISSVTFTGNFARSGGTCAGSLLAGQTCTIGVRFTPLASGPAVGQLNVVASDQASPHTAALSGNGIAPVASMSPAALTFSTPLNVPSAAQTVTVTNTGTAPLTINNVTRTGANPAQFAHVASCPGSLPAGASCTITVTFSPTNANPPTKTATLNLVVAAPETNKTVALTGNIVVPTFTMSPAALAFGGQARLTVSAPRVVTVTNTGTAPLRINNVTRTGATPGQFALTNTCGPFPATLAVGGSCTINVTFRPTTLGAKTASLRVGVAAPATSQSIPLSGTGQ